MSGRTLDEEREYLEGLLNTRFNFLILLMSAFGAGLLAQDGLGTDKARLLLVAGALASAGMGLIVHRSIALLQVMLDILLGDRAANGDPDAVSPGTGAAAAPSAGDHPYRIAYYWAARGGWHRRLVANRVMEAILVLITAAFALGAALSFAGAFAP